MSSNPLPGYDAWKLATPWDDQPEICDHCDGEGYSCEQVDLAGLFDGEDEITGEDRTLACPNCEGTGKIW